MSKFQVAEQLLRRSNKKDKLADEGPSEGISPAKPPAS